MNNNDYVYLNNKNYENVDKNQNYYLKYNSYFFIKIS